MNEEEKAHYLKDYLDHEGIALDASKIAKNKGRRKTSKLCLTSFWGKFGQRGNMSQSVMCMADKDFFRYILNDQLEIEGLFSSPHNERVTEILYHEKEIIAAEPLNTNIYIACFTTSLARLRLYGTLKKLGSRVLYYDTDSVIYRRSVPDRPGDYQVPLGPYLGDLTDELSSDPEAALHITDFVSTGPKAYSYRDSEGRVKCKFKGVSHTLFNHHVVNFESMLLCVQKGKVWTVDGAKNLIFNLDRFGRISTTYQSKHFRMVYDKRWIGADYVTYPWGY